MRVFAGPVSLLITSDPELIEGNQLKLAIPPRFNSIRAMLASRNSASSINETKGAPSPPTAVCFCRKSETTGSPDATAS